VTPAFFRRGGRERPGAALLGRIVVVALVAAALTSIPWLDRLRPGPDEERVGQDLVVWSARDSGPGSLREALFSAARANRRAHIWIRVPRISIEAPLPPLANPRGVIIESRNGAVLEAAPTSSHTPLLEVRADDSVLRNLTLRAEGSTAVSVFAQNLLIEHLTIVDSDIGLDVLSSPARLTVRKTQLRANRVGVQLQKGASEGVIETSVFEGQLDTSLWAVWPPLDRAPPMGSFRVRDNTFHGGRNAVIVANAPLAIDRNTFSDCSETAVSVLGGAVLVRSNHVSAVRRTAILADSTERSEITDNEIHHNPGTAISLRSAAQTLVIRNRIYDNGYGIVAIYGQSAEPETIAENIISGQQLDGLIIIGASPIVRANRALANGGAGIRLLDVVSPRHSRVRAAPLLDANVVVGNARDGIVRGDYSM
jgi:parallel beta-helix repeat protein